MKRVLFGSVSNRVLHEATQPVLIVTGDQAKEEPDRESAEETETVEQHAA